MMRLWKSINSYMYDERQLALLSQLAEMHMDPSISDPARINDIPDDALEPGEERVRWKADEDMGGDSAKPWRGIYKDVGIFSSEEWDFILCKCLGSMGLSRHITILVVLLIALLLEIPLADSGSLTTGSTADGQASFEFSRLPKSTWRICMSFRYRSKDRNLSHYIQFLWLG